MPRGKRLSLSLIRALDTSKEHDISPTFAAHALGIRPARAMRHYNETTSCALPYPQAQKIIERKHSSVSSYQSRMANIRRTQLVNMLLAHYISTHLAGRTHTELARAMGVSHDAVSKYARGDIIPREEKQFRLFQILEETFQPPFTTIEEYVGFAMSTCSGDHSEGYE